MYIERQIRLAIDYWSLILENFEQFSKRRNLLFNKFVNEFSENIVFSDKYDFQFTNENALKLFKILNEIIFNNALETIPFTFLTKSDFSALYKNVKNPYGKYERILEPIFKSNDEDISICRIKLSPTIGIKDFKITNESIKLFNGPKTFAFGVNCLCHEMIHMFNMHMTDIKFDIIVALLNNKEFDTHDYNFKVKMKEANNMGLNIRVATDGKSFEELNDDDIKKLQALQEAEYAKKKKDWDNAIYSNHFYTMEELAKNLSTAMNTDGEFKEVKIIDGYKIYIAES